MTIPYKGVQIGHRNGVCFLPVKANPFALTCLAAEYSSYMLDYRWFTLSGYTLICGGYMRV